MRRRTRPGQWVEIRFRFPRGLISAVVTEMTRRQFTSTADFLRCILREACAKHSTR